MFKVLAMSQNVLGGWRVSKTKVTSLLTAAVNLCQLMGWINLTTEQWLAVNAVLASLIALFMRDSIDPSDKP